MNKDQKIDVLDHGYIKLIETWGSDERIIEAARMSTDKGFQGWGHDAYWRDDTTEDGSKPTLHQAIVGDEKLLSYLYNHKHMTPFEMAGMIIEVQAPIFVFREWHRHRTQSYNELSSRYTELPNLFYVPELERIVKQSKKNKQVGDDQFDESNAISLRLDIKDECEHARKTYERLLRLGVAREIARLVIPVAQYSRMRASANLRNWLQFLILRMDENAQWEIRQYANVISSILEENFPRTMKLFLGE